MDFSLGLLSEILELASSLDPTVRQQVLAFVHLIERPEAVTASLIIGEAGAIELRLAHAATGEPEAE